MSSSQPSPQQPPPRKLNKKALIALLIIAMPSTILLTPALYYGSFTLQIARIVFNETTSLGQPSLAYSKAGGRAEPHSDYDYTFTIEPRGILRTSDTSTSTSQVTTHLSINLTVTTYAEKTVFSSITTLNGE